MKLKNSILLLVFVFSTMDVFPQKKEDFSGKYISGKGDVEYLESLDKAYRLLRPDGELPNLSMLYFLRWNGFVEGPTWDAWWVQNSLGASYTMLPFLDQGFQTFLANAQALWFKMQGNGERKDARGCAAPKGSLCDAARPNFVVYKQGDSDYDNSDWGFGFTAGGLILQSELLLINRNKDSIHKYLPMLEDAAEFIDSRRDPVRNIFLVGASANLLAPSYSGTGKKLPEGGYEKAYLAELSVNYIAGLNRLIELEKMANRQDKIKLYEDRRNKVISGLKYFMTSEGYFIRALAPDGTKHGEFGAPKYGYFDATPNHDAMAFRVVDDQQAQIIYNKINSIPGLRPKGHIIPNYPAYDDMYAYDGLFQYGTWVNGGYWTTTEARMLIGYYRTGAYHDARSCFEKILNLAYQFKMDNPMTDFGAQLYQPTLPINIVYDSWGAPGGFLRGLFEYIYSADGLTLIPHIPTGITRLEQKFPIYYGNNRIYITVSGNGPITSVTVNGKKHTAFDSKSIKLNLSADPGITLVNIGADGQPTIKKKSISESLFIIPKNKDFWDIEKLLDNPSEVNVDKQLLQDVADYYSKLAKSKLDYIYEFKHSQLILESVQSINDRIEMKRQGKLPLLAPESQNAADMVYVTTVQNLCKGLQDYLEQNPQSKGAKYWKN